MLLAVFVSTRIICGFLAGHPAIYTPSVDPIIADTQLYGLWAHDIVDRRHVPYAETRIEYPPGALPFIIAPVVMSAIHAPYLLGFVALMALIDGAGLVGLIVLARRWGSPMGPWIWTLGVPLLGPLSWLRLDMVPAVCTILAVAAASTSRWGPTGALLAFGALTKVYPALLMPAAWIATSRRRAFVVGALFVVCLLVLPFSASLGRMASSVASYHLRRGIQAESLWANGLYLAHRLDHYPLVIVFEFGSNHVRSAISPLLKQVSTVLSVGTLVPGIFVAASAARRDDARKLVDVMFVTLSLLLVTGRVLSPQYILWLIALGAASACVERSPIRGPVVLVVLIASVTQILYPFMINAVPPPGAPPVNASSLPLTVLTVRNALLIAVAGWSLTALWKASRPHTLGPRRHDFDVEWQRRASEGSAAGPA